ncbi:MAG TPA: endonuclease/exonuclease/phosphatase family protein [Candidatus Limnocylindria bacterium]|nr:endonuclease/exonuclease/phosphatase family protein [Candidatus Limnocylindria bacterium]
MEKGPERERRQPWYGTCLLASALMVGAICSAEGPLEGGTIWLDGGVEPAEGVTRPTDHLTIATYNVKNGQIDRQGVIETIGSLGAGIVGLNEVSPDLVREIADEGDYRYRFGQTTTQDGKPFGNALLVDRTYNILDHHNIPLPDGGHEPRAVLHVRVATGEGPSLDVFATHLIPKKWGDSRNSVRLRQAHALLAAVDKYGSERVAVLGDLNEEEGVAYDLIRGRFRDGVDDAGLDSLTTFSNGYDQRRLDHIFFSLPSQSAIGGGRSGSYASDHEALGVVVDLTS